ncbi:MAG: hypothetical protein UW68_C0019G0014 [Candidatus Collierbacteria bacterium GW2011_GWB1_44_6]|uniref:Uncharacterized protein n=2 Tax=Candidatus Collieribacteriota TaxID=1752725 RepID=A0A0G1JNN7_9BACT|nr:MAG: hypothetical protein UV68_C0036G0012 [Candidatus Collierbacteria bacterium GW2011_GWC2_43_12]KKT73000.1 MAG: hypothetical protein UW68_C0019G0014 [Candidatus Collierbacteria bacterium GW2011_GWB1_44_6]
MIINFGLLSSFEEEKLFFGKEVPMVIGTSKDSDSLGNDVVLDAGHNLSTLRADR